MSLMRGVVMILKIILLPVYNHDIEIMNAAFCLPVKMPMGDI